MAIFEERGLFWWADEAVPEKQFAPDSCVAGLLIIGDDGQTRLELDGYFPSKHGPMTPMMRRGQLIDKDIQGLLKTSNKRVLLNGLTGGGGQFSTNGLSYERYIAGQCLVADGFAKPPATRAFKEIIVPLAGFEEWLRLAAIKVTSSNRMVSVKYKRPKDAVYPTTDGKLSIHFESAGDSSGTLFGMALSLKETASAVLRFRKPLALKDLIAQYQLLEDLLLMLTGSDHTLDWPWIAAGKIAQYRLYFPKLGSKAESPPPKAHECVTNFVQLRERFGDIWSDWKKKREAFGPGFYLYLGTRRGVRLYIENRFVNLVFGLEAFHRRKYPPSGETKLDAKIERIVAEVSRAKDKKWLADVLERAKDQPPLGQRIYATLREVPLGLDETRLKSFCEVCGKLRNDISHFGGQRHNETPYNDFILDLESKGHALAALYQALLLYEIGIDAKIIKAWMFDGFGSFPIKYHFVKADLLDKSVLDPKQ
jgi:ApeA N-terminal domain 1